MQRGAHGASSSTCALSVRPLLSSLLLVLSYRLSRQAPAAPAGALALSRPLLSRLYPRSSLSSRFWSLISPPDPLPSLFSSPFLILSSLVQHLRTRQRSEVIRAIVPADSPHLLQCAARSAPPAPTTRRRSTARPVQNTLQRPAICHESTQNAPRAVQKRGAGHSASRGWSAHVAVQLGRGGRELRDERVVHALSARPSPG